MESKSITPQELKVKTPDSLRGGVYANVTNLNVTPQEVVLNFIYANPNDTPAGTLVSRVIISRDHAQQLMNLLKDAVSMANEVDPK